MGAKNIFHEFYKAFPSRAIQIRIISFSCTTRVSSSTRYPCHIFKVLKVHPKRTKHKTPALISSTHQVLIRNSALILYIVSKKIYSYRMESNSSPVLCLVTHAYGFSRRTCTTRLSVEYLLLDLVGVELRLPKHLQQVADVLLRALRLLVLHKLEQVLHDAEDFLDPLEPDADEVGQVLNVWKLRFEIMDFFFAGFLLEGGAPRNHENVLHDSAEERRGDALKREVPECFVHEALRELHDGQLDDCYHLRDVEKRPAHRLQDFPERLEVIAGDVLVRQHVVLELDGHKREEPRQRHRLELVRPGLPARRLEPERALEEGEVLRVLHWRPPERLGAHKLDEEHHALGEDRMGVQDGLAEDPPLAAREHLAAVADVAVDKVPEDVEEFEVECVAVLDQAHVGVPRVRFVVNQFDGADEVRWVRELRPLEAPLVEVDGRWERDLRGLLLGVPPHPADLRVRAMALQEHSDELRAEREDRLEDAADLTRVEPRALVHDAEREGGVEERRAEQADGEVQQHRLRRKGRRFRHPAELPVFAQDDRVDGRLGGDGLDLGGALREIDDVVLDVQYDARRHVGLRPEEPRRTEDVRDERHAVVVAQLREGVSRRADELDMRENRRAILPADLEELIDDRLVLEAGSPRAGGVCDSLAGVFRGMCVALWKDGSRRGSLLQRSDAIAVDPIEDEQDCHVQVTESEQLLE